MAQKSLKKNAILNICKTAAGLLFPLVTFPYVSRVLGPENVGKVNYASSIVQYFAIFAALGTATYGMREAAKVRDDAQKLNQLVKEVFVINLLSTLASYALFFMAVFLVPNFAGYRILLLVSCTSILFTTLGMDWVYNALEEYAYITVRSLCFLFVSLVLLFVFVRNRNDYIQYAAVTVISSVGSNVLNFIHLRKKISFRGGSRMELKKHLKPVFILFATAVAISLYTILDTTMLGFISGDEETGYYSAAIKLNRIVISVITAVGFVLRPRLSNYAETDKSAFDSLVRDTANIYQLLCIPAVSALLFLSGPVILLFCGREYAAAVPVMRIITPVILFIAFGQFFSDQIFLPTRNDAFSFYPVLIAAVLNVCMNAVLIPRYGAMGAALATVISEAVVCFVKLVLCARVMKGVLSLFNRLWQYVLSSLVMVTALLLLRKFAGNGTASLLMLSVIAGAAVYALCLCAVRNEYALRIVRAMAVRTKGANYGK